MGSAAGAAGPVPRNGLGQFSPAYEPRIAAGKVALIHIGKIRA